MSRVAGGWIPSAQNDIEANEDGAPDEDQELERTLAKAESP